MDRMALKNSAPASEYRAYATHIVYTLSLETGFLQWSMGEKDCHTLYTFYTGTMLTEINILCFQN